jgi:hypothetical protein
MKQAGKGVIGMKILGQGDLRDRIDEALQFATAQEVLDCFTIGSESRASWKACSRRSPRPAFGGSTLRLHWFYVDRHRPEQQVVKIEAEIG